MLVLPKNTILENDDLSLQGILCSENPDLAIIVPVNAKGGLANALFLLKDVSQYAGALRFQVILVVNNYDPEDPPKEFFDVYRKAGVVVLEFPQLPGHSGVPPGLRARMAGLSHVNCRGSVFFDADCRIPHPIQCSGWYCKAFENPEVKLAYTRIAYFNWPPGLGMWLWLRVHYSWRWTKRNLMRIPTPQGASYAMDVKLKEKLYNEGYLADETAIGRLAQRFDHKSMFNGSKSCRILTDARMYENARPSRLFTVYALRRIRINLASLVVRNDSAEHAGRENDNPHQYDDVGRCIDHSEK